MRYLLVIGFACDVYRREPQARLYLDDQLIDDFNISQNLDYVCVALHNCKTKLHRLQPFSHSTHDNLLIQNFPALRFYEVEIDKKIERLSIRIDINNSDSNYTNGFMTKTTLIRFKYCHFFPLDKRVLSKLSEISKINRLSKNYAWYRTSKNFIFNLVQNGMHWKGVNGQKIANFLNINSVSKKMLNFAEISVGGDGNFFCHLTKKYGIFIPTLLRPYRCHFDWRITSYFFDKYCQHANQRNNN